MRFNKKFAAAVVSAAMAVSSLPMANFSVSATDHNYIEALAMSLYFFDSNACGKGVTDGPLTWRGDCHTYDAEASVGSLDGSLKSIVDPDGDGKVDVSGGWHDAGDHIKFNITIGFALSSLGMSDYFNEGIYEKAGCRDHLEYEMKWGADYLMKTTFLDDSGNVVAVAHTVADGGVDHSFWTSPETQTYDRPIFWLTASDNNSAVCCEMAAGLGAAAYVTKDSDPEYSQKCIKYAKALLNFGTKNVGNNTGGIGGFYGTDAQYQDEEAVAQAWLWILGAGDKPSRVPNNKDYGGSQYDGWVYSWDKVWQGYAALMYKATGDKAFKDELIVELNGQNGLKIGTYNTNGWGTSRINCALQMDAYSVADGDPNSEYAQGAKWQLDYILGDNNLGYSFLLGFGDKWPTHIHHRAANPGEGQTSAGNPSAKYTNYGMLVGGIDGSGYEDHADRYQYTEGALDYNGCFAIACSFAAALYGGDASAFDAVKKSASEINDSFKFSDNGGGPIIVDPIIYEVVVSVYDNDTGELLNGAELEIERHKSLGETETWNTSEENPKTIAVTDGFWETSSPSEYKLTLKTLPDGYTSEKTEWTFKDFLTGSSIIECAIELKKSAYSLVPSKETVKTGEKFSVGIKGWDRPTRDWNVSVDSDSVKIDNYSPVSFDVTIEKPGTYEITVNFTGGVSQTVKITAEAAGSEDRVWGDANCDGQVTIADSTAILQHLGNEDKYGLSEKGLKNADVDGKNGVTTEDALTIQMIDAKLLTVDQLPLK